MNRNANSGNECTSGQPAASASRLLADPLHADVARRQIRLVGRAGLNAKGIEYSRAHLWRLEQQGRFPRRVRVGNGRVAWVEHEINDYLDELAAARNAKRFT